MPQGSQRSQDDSWVPAGRVRRGCHATEEHTLL